MTHRPLLLAVALAIACTTARAATITVTTAVDDLSPNNGSVSLREAITAINAGNDLGDPDITAQTPGTFGTNDAIHFNIAGAGVHTIDLGADASALHIPLPIVTKPVVIDGYTQTGAKPNTLAVGNDAILLIELNGTSAGEPLGGLLEISAGNSTVKGLVINRAQGGSSVGLRFTTNGGNTVSGNFIGLDPTGSLARPNGCQCLGVVSASGNTIGGLTPADRNVVGAAEGCSEGVVIDDSSNNQILNNYIGTNAAGTASLGSSVGILLYADGSNNIIGGTTAAARNVISGNYLGVALAGNATGNLIEGNFIGTDASGTQALGNAEGFRLSESCHDNTIGGTAPGAGNMIAFNTIVGINLLGATHAAGPGNAILGNSIFSNSQLGIDLVGGTQDANGVTANDLGDPDTGPNNLQNYPLLTSATSDGVTLTIGGTLNSTPATMYRLEFFSSSACDPSGFGEGQTFLGFAMQATDATGNASINAAVGAPADGVFITATATDSAGNTSEFSNCIAAVRPTDAQLNGSVILQGRPAAPNARWIVPLQVSLTPEGGGSALNCTIATDPNGHFTCVFPPGSYTACVKNNHTLQNCRDVTLAVGPNPVSFCTLREGDANNSNCVTVVDFSILTTAFGTCAGTAGFDARADFDGNGCVQVVDFSLLATNFAQCGPLACM